MWALEPSFFYVHHIFVNGEIACVDTSATKFTDNSADFP